MNFLSWLSEKTLSLYFWAVTKTELVLRPLGWLFKKVLRPLASFALKLCFALLFVGSVIAFIFNAPALHQEYIRAFVGSNVYYVSATGAGGGTAFAIDAPSGKVYFMTNDHICVGSEDGYVWITPERGYPLKRKIVARSKTTDLCIIEAPLVNARLFLAGSTYPGDRVQAVGHPALLALTLSNIGQVIQSGPMALVDREGAEYSPAPIIDTAKCDTKNPKFQLIKGKDGHKYCQINVPSVFFTNVLIQPGNSGSPLVNFMGDVVGVVSGVDEYGWAVAVSLGEIYAFLSDK